MAHEKLFSQHKRNQTGKNWWKVKKKIQKIRFSGYLKIFSDFWQISKVLHTLIFTFQTKRRRKDRTN